MKEVIKLQVIMSNEFSVLFSLRERHFICISPQKVMTGIKQEM